MWVVAKHQQVCESVFNALEKCQGQGQAKKRHKKKPNRKVLWTDFQPDCWCISIRPTSSFIYFYSLIRVLRIFMKNAPEQLYIFHEIYISAKSLKCPVYLYGTAWAARHVT